MRWERLFADLEARFEADERLGLDADVAGLVRAERGRLTLADRLRPHLGSELSWHLNWPLISADGPHDGAAVHAVLQDAGPDWLLLERTSPAGFRPVARPQLLVPLHSVLGVTGLTRAARTDDREVTRRLGLTVILRALSRDRVPVRLFTPANEVAGTIDRVGADHLDLAVHDLDTPRHHRQVREVRVVPLAAVTVIARTDDSV